jgi:hypothetical protein
MWWKVANVKMSLRSPRRLWGCWSMAAGINFATSWRRVVSFTSRPTLPRIKSHRCPLNKSRGVGIHSLTGQHGKGETILASARNRRPPWSWSPWPSHYTEWAIPPPISAEERKHNEDDRFHVKSTKCSRDAALTSLRHWMSAKLPGVTFHSKESYRTAYIVNALRVR